MKANRSDIVVGRVLHEDDERITIEFGKTENVSFHVAPLDPSDKPAEFVTVLFIHQVNGRTVAWKPWEADRAA